MGEACLQHSTGASAVPPVPHLSPRDEDVAWYALKVRTGGEPAVVAALEYRGYSPYCPTKKERLRYSDRMKTVDTAVFPGYVFCRFDAGRKAPVISSPGVEYIVGFGNGPVAVPEQELMNIRRMIEVGACTTQSLTTGQRVRVTHGPLEGVEGRLIRDTTGNRLVVSIELLNQGASLRISQDHVCPVGQD